MSCLLLLLLTFSQYPRNGVRGVRASTAGIAVQG